MPEAVMGIDPGVRGGIAVLSKDGTIAWLVGLRPLMTEGTVTEEIRMAVDVLRLYGGRSCYMEKVAGHPTDSRRGAFTFGRIYGYLRSGLRMLDVSISDVTPQMWMSKLDCLTGGNKNVSKRKAMELFPAAGKVGHDVADALLIAAYGQRVSPIR